ncbi:HPr kinase/phosphorylase [Tropicibacter naphthalenivorans]|uniref:HPr kinase/phosphorylase n=1 Tax=Tropicibacter naphthalenivorans TaxID=441103 RepID=UPI001F1667BF|nr:serine kinase [Tropicibacter naphthalenivorans]
MLIQGPSGSGKSGLALEMMARGAQLVSDDQTVLTVSDKGILADAPDAIKGMIESRGIGLLNAAPAGPTPLAAVLDMSQTDGARLPPIRKIKLLGHDLPLLHNFASPYFAAGLVQYLKGDRREHS